MPGGKNAKKKSAKPRLTDSARAGPFFLSDKHKNKLVALNWNA
jgi:hypothetical protein